MFLLAALLIALITVPLAGGRLGALDQVKLKWGWTLAAGLGLQILIISIFPDRFEVVHPYVHVASYLFIGAFVWANRFTPGIILIGLGGLSNLIAISANGGTMPARAAALRAAGVVQEAGDFVNSGVVEDPKLGFLGDVFAIPKEIPILNNVFSVGDVLIAIGAFVLIHALCESKLGTGWFARLKIGNPPSAPASIDRAVLEKAPALLTPAGVTDDGHSVLLRGPEGESYELKIDESLVAQLQVAADRVRPAAAQQANPAQDVKRGAATATPL